MIRINKAYLAFGMLFVAGFSSGVWVHTTQAQLTMGLPYGGMITHMDECTCSAGIYVVSGGPVPAMTLVRPKPAGAQGAPGVYGFFVFRPGAWNLGLSLPCDICRTARLCHPLPTTGEVGTCGIVGTSM